MQQDKLNIYEAKFILGRHKTPNWQLWNHPSTSQELQDKQAPWSIVMSSHSQLDNKNTLPFTPGSRLLVIKPCQDFIMWLQVLNHHLLSNQNKGPAEPCSSCIQHMLHRLYDAVLDNSIEETIGEHALPTRIVWKKLFPSFIATNFGTCLS